MLHVTAHAEVESNDHTFDEAECFEFLGDQSTADRLCIEHYDLNRSLDRTLRLAKQHNQEVLRMVTAQLTEQENKAA